MNTISIIKALNVLDYILVSMKIIALWGNFYFMWIIEKIKIVLKLQKELVSTKE
jgi:hypothetical protein